jgi:hypothetical protein
MNQQKNADEYRNKILAQSAELMQQLATNSGFFKYYYKVLPKFNSQHAAFLIVNQLYYLLFGEEKYNSFDGFRKAKNRDLKN